MMDSRDCACGSLTIREAAAHWFVRLQDGALSPQEQADLAAWRAKHPQHQDELDLLQGLWSAADLLPATRLQALCVEAPARRRRPLLRYAVAAGVVAVAVGLGLFSGVQRPADYRAEFTTASGERRHIALPDGSVVDLDARSHLVVHYQAGRRAVALSRGEAMFSVEHDSSRPFVVDVGTGQVTVTGTRFDVRREAHETQVAVAAGTVKVQGRDAPADQFVSLSAGLGSRIDGRGRVSPAQAVNIEDFTAWRSGKLVFRDASLYEVAAQVSRYSAQPLRVNDPAIGALRLSSVFKADDTAALLRALPNILPVAIRTLDDGSVEIIAR